MDVRWQRMLSCILKEPNGAEDSTWLNPDCSTWTHHMRVSGQGCCSNWETDEGS